MTLGNKWKRCEPGTLQEVAKRQRQDDHRQTLTRRALFSTVLVAGAGVTYSLMQYSGIGQTSLTCQQTCELAASFVRKELGAQKAKLVSAHLAICPKCSEHVARLTQELQA